MGLRQSGRQLNWKSDWMKGSMLSFNDINIALQLICQQVGMDHGGQGEGILIENGGWWQVELVLWVLHLIPYR